MAKDTMGIYIDLQEMTSTLFDAMFCMTAANRVIFGDKAIDYCMRSAAHFQMAYDCRDKRLEFTDMAIAEFIVSRDICRTMAEKNVISLCHTKEGGGIKPEGVKKRLFDRIASIDMQIGKWRASITRARTAPSNRPAVSSDTFEGASTLI